MPDCAHVKRVEKDVPLLAARSGGAVRIGGIGLLFSHFETPFSILDSDCRFFSADFRTVEVTKCCSLFSNRIRNDFEVELQKTQGAPGHSMAILEEPLATLSHGLKDSDTRHHPWDGCGVNSHAHEPEMPGIQCCNNGVHCVIHSSNPRPRAPDNGSALEMLVCCYEHHAIYV